MRLGHAVFPVNSAEKTANLLPRILTQLNRVIHKLYARNICSVGTFDPSHANARIVNLAQVQRPHLVWLDKALHITPETFAAIRLGHPQALIVGFSPDDMTQRFNRSHHFFSTIGMYDAYFTTKSYGVSELRGMGCPQVFFAGNGYCPESHKPVEVTEQDREIYGAPVTFIGTYEEDRAASLVRLCHAGIPVRVWGNGWGRLRGRVDGLRIEGRGIYEVEYAKVVCATKINLCFLRKANRDRQTTRSVELPACGGFMMAERTDEHCNLFAEQREAVFFGDDRELVSLCRYYLDHDEERESIARAGLARCVSSGYSNDARIKGMLQQVASLQFRSRPPHDTMRPEDVPQ